MEKPVTPAAVLRDFVVASLVNRPDLARQRTLAQTLACRQVTVPSAGHEQPPVVDLLDAAADNVERDLPSVATAVRALAPTLGWTRTASYLACPPDQTFLAKYAHATVVGPADGADTLGSRDQASIGLVLLGPGVHYPPHHHPADEVYVVCSRTWWLDGAGSFTPRQSGAIVHHQPWQPHAMRVSEDDPPALLIYLWTGDVLSPSRWLTPEA